MVAFGVFVALFLLLIFVQHRLGAFGFGCQPDISLPALFAVFIGMINFIALNQFRVVHFKQFAALSLVLQMRVLIVGIPAQGLTLKVPVKPDIRVYTDPITVAFRREFEVVIQADVDPRVLFMCVIKARSLYRIQIPLCSAQV